MDFVIGADDLAFRRDMRAWIGATLPSEIATRGRRGFHATRSDVESWTRRLNAKGWAAPAWPEAHGGTNWTPLQRYLFQLELRAAAAPVQDQSAMELVGPVIYTFGDEVQKRVHLPRILNADTFWCQGFSEPNAGSDLASLRTRAVLDGDHYVVNGQKTWTSDAQRADMMFALVRTDAEARPQAGISFLLIDMKSPGVRVRPIYSIDEGHSVNEVFFDDVRVPTENIVGEPNKGWSYAKFLLTNERAMSAETAHTRADLLQLKGFAGEKACEPLFCAKLSKLEVDLMALEFAVLRVLHAEGGAQDAVASVLKLRGAELRQRVAELGVEALGNVGLAVNPDPTGHDATDHPAARPPGPDHAVGWLARSMFRRATTIYGGSNEIQRNIIAKAVLSL
ncbi:acyl-CoA dehydrogenase family protein [Terricaulis silvestris]|uniref:Glutaryl-CoA dehydrogenase n=1 Tax=Terricaulis silvestris TaxID=2686094 RepID=A0A6I6MLU4_9CAUL|nr:acyl-CoA dehydrogenase family protein [Terricaulis silvestris]QGZ96200.1 Glutaryl-CoA dehydrogenase [Terricaulis silvestris]